MLLDGFNLSSEILVVQAQLAAQFLHPVAGFNLSSEILVVQARAVGNRQSRPPKVSISQARFWWFKPSRWVSRSIACRFQSLKRDFGGSSLCWRPSSLISGRFQSLKRDFGGSSKQTGQESGCHDQVSISQARFWWFKPVSGACAQRSWPVSISQARFWWFKLLKTARAIVGETVSISQARFWWFKRYHFRLPILLRHGFNLSSEILVVQAGEWESPGG